jgi:secreted effector protein SseD
MAISNTPVPKPRSEPETTRSMAPISTTGTATDGLVTLMLLAKLMIEIRSGERNTDQAYRARHDVMLFARGVAARDEKYRANRKHYDAAMTQAGGSLFTGVLSLGGSVVGARYGLRDKLEIGQAIGGVVSGVGQFGKPAFEFAAADLSNRGRDNEVVGEFANSLTDETRRTNERLRQRIDTASAEMRDVSRQLYGMAGQHLAKLYEAIR